MGKITKDIRTRQQVQQLGMYQKMRRREKSGKSSALNRKGGKKLGKVIDFICQMALISFVILFIVTVLYVIGMIILYFHSELDKDEHTEIYSEWQRIEDELQIQALKEDAKRREAKKREKERRRKNRRWKKRNS